MARTPRKFSPEFKAKVVLDILTSGKSFGQASREYGIKDSVISRWEQEFLERAPSLFESGGASDERDRRIAELDRLVGRLALELVMAKKVSGSLNSRPGGEEK